MMCAGVRACVRAYVREWLVRGRRACVKGVWERGEREREQRENREGDNRARENREREI